VDVLILGIITDPIFSVFPVNSTLFLDDLGGITDVTPTQPTKTHLTVIGKSLGGNDILVSVSPPVTLGV
jgi:hypothetical protein